jgi:hypothetical protein
MKLRDSLPGTASFQPAPDVAALWCGQDARGPRENSLRQLCFGLLCLISLVISSPSAAQGVAGDTFEDSKDGAKVHAASGLICPAKIGIFERDAVGEFDPQSRADFCAYSALDGVYGTIRITPVDASYDPKVSLAHDFAEQEATGGKKIAEGTIDISTKGAPPLSVYTRSYETAELGELHYRVLLTGAEVKTWAVETTIEFAAPRDAGVETDFLHAVYEAVPREIGVH